MELIDEKGRLFGRVNIVDALVVLFAIAVLAAGAALVFGDDPNANETEPNADRSLAEDPKVMFVATDSAMYTPEIRDVPSSELDLSTAPYTTAPSRSASNERSSSKRTPMSSKPKSSA